MKKYFILSVALILCLTGFIKLLAAVQRTSFLNEADPLFAYFSNRQMSIIVGLLETGLATLLFLSKSDTMRLGSVLWLGLLFLLYRVGLSVVHYRGPCSCIGGAITWFTQSREARVAVDSALKTIIAYFTIPSSIFLISSRRAQVPRSPGLTERQMLETIPPIHKKL